MSGPVVHCVRHIEFICACAPVSVCVSVCVSVRKRAGCGVGGSHTVPVLFFCGLFLCSSITVHKHLQQHGSVSPDRVFVIHMT